MIKKLRRKFILISALSVFFVLALTIGAINISNYVVIENNSKNALTEIINQGPRENIGGPQGPGGNKEQMPRERYFIVSINNEGTVQKVDKEQMPFLSEEECQTLALKVYSKEITGGKYGNYRYKKSTKNDGLTYVAFIDIKEQLDSASNFLLVSSLISIGAYLALIALIIVASKIAFKSSEEAYKKQKRFITNASHELKTPLTVISADLDLIEMDNGKSEWSESLRDQVSRLVEMTNQLVTLSKLEEEDPNKFPFETFSLNEVCKPIIDSFSVLFKKDNIQFTSNIEDNLLMNGNKRLIDELMHIFLDNSLKYTGGDNKQSSFDIFKNNKDKIIFKFSNTLDKNDEIDVKQIMDRFYRSSSTKKEGSGIGLSIAQEIINLHKGKISIEKDDKIITFVIVF